MRGIRFAATGVLCLLLVGCGDARVDGQESLNDVKESLPPEEQTKFQSAVLYLMVGQAMEKGQPLTIDALNGKTAAEVIALAESTKADLQAKREAAQREKAQQEIAELQARQADAVKARKVLDQFVVERSSVRVSEGYIKQPVIELAVKNTTSHAIARVFFRAVYATPGRQVPWAEDTFNYSISGGLEPGEAATWSLAPNQFDTLGRAIMETAAGAVLILSVTKLEGPGESVISDGQGLSDRDMKRLEELVKEYGMPSPAS